MLVQMIMLDNIAFTSSCSALIILFPQISPCFAIDVMLYSLTEIKPFSCYCGAFIIVCIYLIMASVSIKIVNWTPIIAVVYYSAKSSFVAF